MVLLHRTNQGGSIVNFVIIGVILVIAVVSVAYVVQKRGEQARKDIAIATVDEQTKNSTSSSTASKPIDVTKTDTNKSTSPSVNRNGDKKEPEPSSNLPATGPEQAIIQMFTLGIVTFVVSSFVMSRAKLARSL